MTETRGPPRFTNPAGMRNLGSASKARRTVESLRVRRALVMRSRSVDCSDVPIQLNIRLSG